MGRVAVAITSNLPAVAGHFYFRRKKRPVSYNGRHCHQHNHNLSLMVQTTISYLWKRPNVARGYRSAVSLHGHTNHSKESLRFIPSYASRWPILSWALERQCRRSAVPVDFVRAYWTPPLTPRLAFEGESKQIQNVLGVEALVSLTDHDTIEAPMLLRVVPQTSHVPVSMEWSVPFGGAVFHLGIHNLPGIQAETIIAELAGYTANPREGELPDLLAMLDDYPEVLIVFNHPAWDLYSMGKGRFRQIVDKFLQYNAGFLHAFEVNATRGWEENNEVLQLARCWRKLLISGGDRHGREPSGAVNLTRSETFAGFVREIRRERRSHVLMMPQYAEPQSIRITQELLDIIREYPEYPAGSRRWDDRVFHPDPSTNSYRPLSSFWKAPPGFLKQVLSAIRLVENTAVRRVLREMSGGEDKTGMALDWGYEALT